jgi:3-mercaptopyruvate sulfurtransferase SseA
MDGFENVVVLHGGMEEWKRQGGFEASKRAVKSYSIQLYKDQ